MTTIFENGAIRKDDPHGNPYVENISSMGVEVPLPSVMRQRPKGMPRWEFEANMAAKGVAVTHRIRTSEPQYINTPQSYDGEYEDRASLVRLARPGDLRKVETLLAAYHIHQRLTEADRALPRGGYRWFWIGAAPEVRRVACFLASSFDGLDLLAGAASPITRCAFKLIYHPDIDASLWPRGTLAAWFEADADRTMAALIR